METGGDDFCIRDWSSDDGRVGLPCWAALAGPRAAVLRRTAVPCCAACGCGCSYGEGGGCNGLLCCAAPPVTAGAAAARTLAATDCLQDFASGASDWNVLRLAGSRQRER